MISKHENLQIFENLLPLHCQSYLKMQRWNKIEDISEYASLWGIQLANSKKVEVILPMTQDLRDYKRRMSEFLEALHIVEERPVTSIITDLLQVNTDKLRIKLNKNSSKNFPFAKAGALLKRSLDMIIATANSLIESKPYFQSRHPKSVEEYIEKLQMGHTERGSFIITVHSPVPPRLGHGVDEEPFERLVIERLSNLLLLSNQIANIGEADAFSKAVEDGISANFCEAVADIVQLSDSEQANFGFSWSPSRAVSRSMESNILLRQDTADVLKEAGKYLRANIPEEGAEVIGYVVRLDKNPNVEHGEVKLLDVFDEQNRYIYLSLENELYKQAIKAHSEGLRVRVIGDLEKKGRKNILHKIVKFNLLPTEDEV